jgi:hypothetical protein
METSLLALPVKAAKFKPMLGARGGLSLLNGSSVFLVSFKVASYDMQENAEDLFLPDHLIISYASIHVCIFKFFNFS